MNDVYIISDNVFGYYNDMNGVDIIVKCQKACEMERIIKIVSEEITNWGECNDTNSHYYYEGYFESASKRLQKENLEVDVYTGDNMKGDD